MNEFMLVSQGELLDTGLVISKKEDFKDLHIKKHTIYAVLENILYIRKIAEESSESYQCKIGLQYPEYGYTEIRNYGVLGGDIEFGFMVKNMGKVVCHGCVNLSEKDYVSRSLEYIENFCRDLPLMEECGSEILGIWLNEKSIESRKVLLDKDGNALLVDSDIMNNKLYVHPLQLKIHHKFSGCSGLWTSCYAI